VQPHPVNPSGWVLMPALVCRKPQSHRKGGVPWRQAEGWCPGAGSMPLRRAEDDPQRLVIVACNGQDGRCNGLMNFGRVLEHVVSVNVKFSSLQRSCKFYQDLGRLHGRYDQCRPTLQVTCVSAVGVTLHDREFCAWGTWRCLLPLPVQGMGVQIAGMKCTCSHQHN
jgi:hypothetical protein